MALLQSISLPSTPSAEIVAIAVLFLLAGMAVPTRYGIERLEGFGRYVASGLPYKPPPGKDEQTAMQEAVDGDGEQASNQQQTNTENKE